MPKLIPAKQNGKPIAVTIAYPIFLNYSYQIIR